LRIYYVIHGATVLILLTAGVKDSQQRDINQAKAILARLLE
jgi:putative addiction module killer protein